MKHIREQIEELRRYIAASEDRRELEEVDSLLSVALEELRRRMNQRRRPAGSDDAR